MHTITIKPDGARFTVRLDIPAIPRQHFADQTAAEHFADGLAFGLRLLGRAVRIDIDVPDDVSDDLDFAMLEPAVTRPAKAATAPERDPVEVRLERDRVSESYRAEYRARG